MSNKETRESYVWNVRYTDTWGKECSVWFQTKHEADEFVASIKENN